MIGRTFDGRYTILERIGAGSIATVYRARQEGTGRDVAVKVLKSGSAADQTSKARFLREARASSQLVSSHTVRVFDFGESESHELFLVMELLDGESVGQRIARVRRLPSTDAINTVLQVLKALDEAHIKGLIHRDLKPANLFCARMADRPEEIVKVLDFGGAKFIAAEGKRLNAMETQQGFAVGTPRYMSPEQARGRELDGRSDLYSLGAVLYHLLTGRAPFMNDDPEEILTQHVRTIPDLPSLVCPEAAITADLDAVVMRLLSKRPEDRPSSAAAAGDELRRLLPAASRPPGSSSRVATPGGDSSTTSPPTAMRDMENEAETIPLQPVATPVGFRSRLKWLVLALAAIVLVVFAARGSRSDVPPVSIIASPASPVPIDSDEAPESPSSPDSPKLVSAEALPRAPVQTRRPKTAPLSAGRTPLPPTATVPIAPAPPSLPIKPVTPDPSGSAYDYFR